MRSSSEIVIFIAVVLVSHLADADRQRKTDKRAVSTGYEKDLLSPSLVEVVSKYRSEGPGKKDVSANTSTYHTVNIPVPYHKVHFRPLNIAKPVAFTKKPDIYINHVHVHDGGTSLGLSSLPLNEVFLTIGSGCIKVRPHTGICRIQRFVFWHM